MRLIDADMLYIEMFDAMYGTGYQSRALDVIDSAIEIELKSNTPLTVEELKAMAWGEWVWIEVSQDFNDKDVNSAYYKKHDDIKQDEWFGCGYPGLGFIFEYSDYGKNWLAYRHKPEETISE